MVNFRKELEMTTAQTDSIAAAIRSRISLQPTERLYAIIDACQAPELVDLAGSKFGQPTRMLFKGAATCFKEVESFAPFFIPVDLETDFLEHWSACWGKNAGILIVSSAEPRGIYRHLRKIFVVQDEEGQEYFFRFYDPRVLRVYLPTCASEQTTEFFGPLIYIFLEGENLETLVTYSHTLGQLNSSIDEIPS